MNKSESIKALATALQLFQVKVGKIKKDAKNPFFKSTYASLSNILDAIADPLAESGLAFSQLPEGDNGLTTILIHSESGEFIESTYMMKPVKDDPQGRGSVITYQRRYALASILGLNIDEDDDGNTATHGGKSPQEAEDNNKPWLNENSEVFTAAIAKLNAGKTTIQKIGEAFKISKAVRAKLEEATKQPA